MTEVSEKEVWFVVVGTHKEPIRTDMGVFHHTDEATWSMVRADSREQAIEIALDGDWGEKKPYVMVSGRIVDVEKGS